MPAIPLVSEVSPACYPGVKVEDFRQWWNDTVHALLLTIFRRN